MSDVQNSEHQLWIEVGQSTTSDTSNTQRADVQLDQYYVVIGFEVNEPLAFQNETHDLSVDFGHAFFYLVKNNIIEDVLSFGPQKSAEKIGWFDLGNPAVPGAELNACNRGAVLKDGRTNTRLGTPDYAIPSFVTAYYIWISAAQGKTLAAKTAEMRERILSGKEMYTAYLNDTCAETARDVLESAGIKTPSGSGWVKHSRLAFMRLAYAVNPYKWNHNLQKSGAPQKHYKPQDEDWLPPVGDEDSIFGGRL